MFERVLSTSLKSTFHTDIEICDKVYKDTTKKSENRKHLRLLPKGE